MIVALAVIAALAAEKPYYPKPAFTAPAYPSYEKTYDYAPMSYSFDWAVLDEPSYNNYGHKETSDGKVVDGTYYVVLPDSRKQVISYNKAGDYGYVADVKNEGDEYKPAYKPAYKPTNAPPAYLKAAYSPPAYSKAYPEPSYSSYPKPTYPSYPAPAYPSYPKPSYPSYPRPAYPSYPRPAYPSYPIS